ncbi:MAG TPA: PAS domain S-box protein, partial [Chitinophagaceae bacterium]|nr:PAS domain S-box protein [Chitinophagaceae bacterium]
PNYIKWNFFSIINESGEVVEFGGFGVSTSSVRKAKEEHKVTQQKLVALLNSTVESFYYLDKNMNVLAFNSGAKYKTMLYYNIELQEGFYFPKLLVPGTEENFYKQFSNALKGVENYIEDKISYSNGKSIWYKMSCKPVYDDKNNIMGVALSFLNIDDIKNAELRLKKIAWQQSHNVRKPLSNILGLVNLLKEDKDIAPNIKDLIDLLDVSAKELDDIIKSIIAKTI